MVDVFWNRSNLVQISSAFYSQQRDWMVVCLSFCRRDPCSLLRTQRLRLWIEHNIQRSQPAWSIYYWIPVQNLSSFLVLIIVINKKVKKIPSKHFVKKYPMFVPKNFRFPQTNPHQIAVPKYFPKRFKNPQNGEKSPSLATLLGICKFRDQYLN